MAGKALHDHLNDKSHNPDRIPEWNTRHIDMLIDLLHEMAVCLGYVDFDKTFIKNSWYAPQAHVDVEKEAQAIRQGFAAIFSGKATFPVTSFAANADEAKEWIEVRRLLIQVLKAINPIPGTTATAGAIQVNVSPAIHQQLNQGRATSSDSDGEVAA